MTQAWYRRPVVGFDLETTGTDPTTARVVTAALVWCDPDGRAGPGSRDWLVNPGIPIPAAATAVHGVTTERAAAAGRPEAEAVAEIVDGLDEIFRAATPLVVFNAPYDLTLIDTAARRHGLTPLVERAGWPTAAIIDPLVIDRAVDRYRRGKRTLQVAVEHYGVEATDAHRADGDALAACRVAQAIAARFPDIAGADPAQLHRAQIDWYAHWAADFQKYLRGRGRADAVIDGTWPMRVG